jgi:hypothetical protein
MDSRVPRSCTLALGKDAPLGRAVQRPGAIVAIPILSGLHHHYSRYDFRKGQFAQVSRSVDQTAIHKRLRSQSDEHRRTRPIECVIERL